jgi:hypothetical protein
LLELLREAVPKLSRIPFPTGSLAPVEEVRHGDLSADRKGEKEWTA